MQIQLEPTDNHSIQEYDQNHVMISGKQYTQNILITETQIISNWDALELSELTSEKFSAVLNEQPEIILLGHKLQQTVRPNLLIQELSKIRVGIECSDIGAACRTFNVLLSENRRVVLAILFHTKKPDI